MRRLTARDALMPAATIVVVMAVSGLILFGTRAVPALALAVGLLVGAVALLIRYTDRHGDPGR